MRPLSKSFLLASALALGAGAFAQGAAADCVTAPQHVQQVQMMMDQYPDGVTADQAASYGEQVFVRYDTDGDGYLSDEEVIVRDKAAVQAEGNVVIFDDHSIQPVDVDGDGRISANEWNTDVQSYFGSLDLNNNGIIDSEEAGTAYPAQ